jgi:hypothetical protein
MHEKNCAFTYLQCRIFVNKYPSRCCISAIERTITLDRTTDVAFLQLTEQLHWTEQVETTGFQARQCILAPRFQASVRFKL